MHQSSVRPKTLTSESPRRTMRQRWMFFLGGLATAGALAGHAPPARAADVDIGVSVQISQPGVYGRIDIGQFPKPRVIVAEPIVVTPSRTVVVRQEPVYMWVPHGHRKNWRKHCREYGACGVPVIFVRHDWYDSHVRPHRHGRGHDDRGHGQDRGRGKGND
jgi:hypothetical protein